MSGDATKMVLAHEAEQRFELARRIGFAKGQIQEALGCVEGNYWAEKALRRALAFALTTCLYQRKHSRSASTGG